MTVTSTAAKPRGDIRDFLVDAAALSIDQLPMLPVIFNKVGSNLADRLRTLGPALPLVSVNRIESMRIGEALDAYDLKAIAGLFHVPEWDNRLIVGFDRDFIFTLVEMLFGGEGSEAPVEDVRALTTIEEQVATFAFEQVGLAVQSAFALVSNARFRFERTETRMDFAAAGRRTQPAVVARFILQALDRGGEMFVIVPQSGLALSRQALSRNVPQEAATADLAWTRKIGEEVGRTEVTMRAVLETNVYTLGDIAGLQVGQLLKLPATLKSRVKVESSEQPLFWAYLGQSDGSHTLSIDEAIDQEREFLADVIGA